MKYSWKSHKDTRNRQKNRKKKEWASSVGFCQKRKPQRPHQVKVSPRGPQNKAFWKLTNGTMGTPHLQNIHFLKKKSIAFCRDLMFEWGFQLYQNTGKSTSVCSTVNKPARNTTLSESASQNLLWCKQCTLIMVDIDETRKQKSKMQVFTRFLSSFL